MSKSYFLRKKRKIFQNVICGIFYPALKSSKETKGYKFTLLCQITFTLLTRIFFFFFLIIKNLRFCYTDTRFHKMLFRPKQKLIRQHRCTSLHLHTGISYIFSYWLKWASSSKKHFREWAKCADSHYPMHSQSIIWAFVLHSCISVGIQ